jgi:hypothetical protein
MQRDTFFSVVAFPSPAVVETDKDSAAVIDLLESWIEEDSRLDGGVETREELKRALDRPQASGRPLPALTQD